MSSTTITLVGNLTREPELRFTASGQATVTLGLAVNRRQRSRANVNEVTESVSFFTVVVWGSLAENTAESLHKGARVVVTGRMEQRTWLDKDGERHTVYEVVADEVGASMRWATASITRAQRSAAVGPRSDQEPGRDSGEGPGGDAPDGLDVDVDVMLDVDVDALDGAPVSHAALVPA